MKKGQLTAFIILGVVILLIAAYLFSLHPAIKKQEIVQSTISLEEIKLYTEGCISLVLENGMFRSGYSNSTKLEDYINKNLKNCTNKFSDFRGIEVIEGNPLSDIKVSDENKQIMVKVSYPLTIKKDGEVSKIEDFSIIYELKSKDDLVTLNGRVAKDYDSISRNRVFNLDIPRGTIVVDKYGKSPNSIMIDIKDASNFTDLIAGFLSYDAQPNGIEFSPFAVIEMSYLDKDNNGLVDGTNINETDLQVAYYDIPTKSWIFIPSSVDIYKKKVSANITRLTEFSMGVPEKILFNMTNPINIERKNEVVMYNAKLPDNKLHLNNSDFVTVYTNWTEKLSDHMNSNIEKYPSGFVKKITFVFQDDFKPNETKSYEIRLNDKGTFLNQSDLNISSLGNRNVEWPREDIGKTYSFATNILNLFNGQNFQIQYGEMGLNIGMPNGQIGLVNFVMDNIKSYCDVESVIFDADTMEQLCHPKSIDDILELTKYYSDKLFKIQSTQGSDWVEELAVSYFYEMPEFRVIEDNKILAVLEFNFLRPKLIEHGSDPEDHTGVTAYSRITFFRNSDRIDTITTYFVNDFFYNHNGFSIGSIGTPMQGARFTFGEQWTKGDEDYLLYVSSAGAGEMYISKGDNEPLDKKMYYTFGRFYAVESDNATSIFGYIPFFKSYTSYFYTDYEKDEIPASGIYHLSFPASNIYIVQSGFGKGWIPVPVETGEYSNFAVYFTDMPFSQDLSDYQKKIILLENPLWLNGKPPQKSAIVIAGKIT